MTERDKRAYKKMANDVESGAAAYEPIIARIKAENERRGNAVIQMDKRIRRLHRWLHKRDKALDVLANEMLTPSETRVRTWSIESVKQLKAYALRKAGEQIDQRGQ